MDPLVPEWRALGARPESSAGTPPNGSAAAGTRRTVPLPLIVGAVLVVAGVLAAVAAGALALAPEPRTLVIDSADTAAETARHVRPAGLIDAIGGSVTAATPLVIDVAGAVARPGIVQVPPGSRVGDAIQLAGGFGPRADLADRDGIVDLNHATQAELEELPGIGPVTAGKIIEARNEQPFRSVEELRGRDVLGQSTFDKVRELVTAG